MHRNSTQGPSSMRNKMGIPSIYSFNRSIYDSNLVENFVTPVFDKYGETKLSLISCNL